MMFNYIIPYLHNNFIALITIELPVGIVTCLYKMKDGLCLSGQTL